MRAALRARLETAWRDGERVLLLGHSLGSVIAYDTLWELTHVHRSSGEVSLLVTFGSPLATHFVQRSTKGAREVGAARYPHNIRRWVNLTARGDTTALQPRVKPLYHEMLDLKLIDSIEDFVEFDNFFRNSLGLNAHEAYGYLAQPCSPKSSATGSNARSTGRREHGVWWLCHSGPDANVSRLRLLAPMYFASLVADGRGPGVPSKLVHRVTRGECASRAASSDFMARLHAGPAPAQHERHVSHRRHGRIAALRRPAVAPEPSAVSRRLVEGLLGGGFELGLDDDVDAAVALAALLGVVVRDRLRLAVADGADARRPASAARSSGTR